MSECADEKSFIIAGTSAVPKPSTNAPGARIEKKIVKLDLDISEEGEPGSSEGLVAVDLTKINTKISALNVGDLVVLDITGTELLAFLDTTEPYEHNRKVDQTKVTRILNFYKKEQLEESRIFDLRSNNICVALVPGTDVRHPGLMRIFLDGSHRRCAIQLLPEPDKVRVLLWVKRCRRDQLRSEFYKINCTTPVPAAYYSQHTAATVNRFIDLVSDAFPDHEKDGKTAVRPHFKRENVLDAITETTDIRDAIIDGAITAEHLFEAFNELNREMEEMYSKLSSKERTARKYPITTQQKVEKLGFYVGLDLGHIWARKVALMAERLLMARTLMETGEL